VRSSHIHPNDFDDAAQDACLRVLRCVQRHDPARGPFRAYCMTAVWARLKSFRGGSRHNRRTVTCDYAATSPTHEAVVTPHDDSAEAVTEVAELLEGLPSEQAAMLRELYGIGGQERSVNQIAALRGLPQREVRQVLTEAFATLRQRSA